MVKKAEEKAVAVATKEATDSDSSAKAGSDSQAKPGDDSPPGMAAASQRSEASAAPLASDLASPAGTRGRKVCKEEDKDATCQPLESLSTLADRHRVPGWQQAALMRLMGWESGKLVSDAEYGAALKRIRNRPMGGGRRA